MQNYIKLFNNILYLVLIYSVGHNIIEIIFI